MDSSTPRRGPLSSVRLRHIVIPLLLAVSATILPTAVASAEPEPTIRELRAEGEKLHTKLEQLTEQYNGLRVRLKQANRAAEAAVADARRQRSELRTIQRRIRELAATSYMNGGLDEATAAFAAAEDPQGFLDRASTLHFFTLQDGSQIQGLARATQAAERSERAEAGRLKEVRRLTDEVDTKERRITKLLADNKDKLQAAVEAQRAEEAKRAREAREKAAREAAEKAAKARASAAPPGDGGGGGSGGASAKALGAVRAAKSKLGAPYVWGGDGPNTFDCSGLTMWAYKQVGISLPHYTGDQWNSGTHVSRSNLVPGDLVFFYSDLHHMGMYVGNGNMIHAPQTGDVVKIVPLAGRPYAGAVRVA